ncbi:MAG: hypothetical protein U9R72_15145 [Chloroflexota bacterium]|nr:hypothetical protein [Chloroflexota bacterium]
MVDVSNLAHPVEIGAYDTHNYAVGVAVDGSYAYVVVMGTAGTAGLHVVDISDPADPNGVGFCQSVGMPRDIVTVDGVAYVANEWGLELIDVSSAYSPTVAGHISLQGEEWAATAGVAVSGTLAYVAGDGGLYTIDVSSPTSPTLVSNFFVSEGCFDADVAEDRAYLTGGGNCLRVVDVSEPVLAENSIRPKNVLLAST